MADGIKKEWKLPSFMRKRELKKYAVDGKLHYIRVGGEIVGFYVLDGKQFKSLFIAPAYRRLGLARKIITEHLADGITIATTHRNCLVKKLIKKLGFYFTGKIVDGKQSKLEIWGSIYTPDMI